jgi:hypothetical protein
MGLGGTFIFTGVWRPVERERERDVTLRGKRKEMDIQQEFEGKYAPPPASSTADSDDEEAFSGTYER